MTIKLEICIPAYDELDNLKYLIPRITAELSNISNLKSKIKIFVRSDEEDVICKEIEKMSATVIKRSPENNFGSAISSAIRHIDTSSDFIIFMDADGSHQPSNISALLSSALDTGSDVVVASRYVAGGKTDNSVPLILMSRLLNFVFQFTMGIKCKDVSTNFKLYKAEILRGIALSSKNYDVVEELLLKAKINSGGDFKITEIPDHFQQRKFGKSKRKLSIFILSYIVTILRLRMVSFRENSRNRG